MHPTEIRLYTHREVLLLRADGSHDLKGLRRTWPFDVVEYRLRWSTCCIALFTDAIVHHVSHQPYSSLYIQCIMQR